MRWLTWCSLRLQEYHLKIQVSALVGRTEGVMRQEVAGIGTAALPNRPPDNETGGSGAASAW